MDKIVELRTLDDEVLHKRSRVSETKITSAFDKDRYELAKAGKQQVLKRRFGLVSMTGLSCGLMCTWESLLVVLFLGFSNGGPAGLIYGFFIIWIGNLSVFIAIGELSSMVPTAGGQYHWVSLLAPQSSKKFFSYITGWLTVIGWIAGLTAASFFVAQLIQTLIAQNHASYHGTGWQGTFLLWAVLLLCVVINIFISRALPAIEVVVLIIHVLGFFAILVPLVYLTPSHNSARDVFTTWNNGGGWSTQALAFFIGLQGNALAFVGTDSAVHMSEEVKNASTDVARSMVLSILINGCLSLGMLIAVLLSAADIDVIAQQGSTFPFIQIFANAVGSNAGATVMTCIIVVLEFCSALGSLAAASRMTWSFARDRGLPLSRFLSMIEKRTTIPVVAVLLVASFSALLALINIGSTTAFNDITSLVLEGFYISYLITVGLLLWRRLRGDIADPVSDHLESFNSSASSTVHTSPGLTWGPWRLKGMWGIVNNILACIYLIILIFFSFWPGQVAVLPATMNYAALVIGSVILFSLVYYFIWARRIYTGPIVEIDLHTL